MCCSASNCLSGFCCFLCYWALVLLHCDQTVCRRLCQFPFICWDLLCDLRYGLFWRRSNGLLRRMFIVLLQDGILCRHLSGPFDLWCHLILEFLCWFFCLVDLSIGDRGVLKSLTTNVLGCICVFKSISACLMKLGAMTLGRYRLIIVISSWCVAPLWSDLLCFFWLI
jgi:hypothetical protein